MRTLRSMLLCLLFCAGGASAQEIDGWVGAWTGTGKLMGADATFSLCVDRAVHANLLRLEYRIEPANGPAFRAAAYYLLAQDGSGAGKWFDSRGVVFDVTMMRADSTLNVTWTGERESGRTEYQLHGSGLEVRDFVHAGGAARQFAQATYTRTDACPL